MSGALCEDCNVPRLVNIDRRNRLVYECPVCGDAIVG